MSVRQITQRTQGVAHFNNAGQRLDLFQVDLAGVSNDNARRAVVCGLLHKGMAVKIISREGDKKVAFGNVSGICGNAVNFGFLTSGDQASAGRSQNFDKCKYRGHTLRTFRKSRLQSLGCDNAVVKCYFLRSQNLIILMAFTGNQNNILSPGQFYRGKNCGLPVGNHGISMRALHKFQMVRRHFSYFLPIDPRLDFADNRQRFFLAWIVGRYNR